MNLSQCHEAEDTIKRWDIRIHGTDGNEITTKDIENLFNKIIKENFTNLEKKQTFKQARHLESQRHITREKLLHNRL